MRDSIGGVVNVFMIAVFLLVVSGYLAFSVSYNKAFRVKNKIITLLEQNGSYTRAQPKIDEYIKEVGYNAANPQSSCKNITGAATYKCNLGYCVTWVDTTKDKDNSAQEIEDVKSGYFKVTTAVNIDVPIINKIMPYLDIFYVSGDTITIYEDNSGEFTMQCT